jgi:hypothetical protein
VTLQLSDEASDLISVAGKFDSRQCLSGLQNPGAFADQLGDLRRGHTRYDQLTAVDVVTSEVFDLDHLDQPLELLADLVYLGVAGVHLERHAEAAGLLARTD